jgi:hypothetical protein
MASNLPIGCGSLVIEVVTGSPDPRQHPFGSGHLPVSGQLSKAAGGGAGHRPRFPAAFRPPALACWAILRPLGNRAFLTVGLPEARFDHRTPTGLSRCTRMRTTGVDAPYTPRTAVPTRPTPHPRPPPAASQRPVPLPRHRFPPTEAKHHDASSRVHFRSPVRSSPACDPRVERESLGFAPSFTPRRYRRRMSRWGRAPGH